MLSQSFGDSVYRGYPPTSQSTVTTYLNLFWRHAALNSRCSRDTPRDNESPAYPANRELCPGERRLGRMPRRNNIVTVHPLTSFQFFFQWSFRSVGEALRWSSSSTLRPAGTK